MKLCGVVTNRSEVSDLEFVCVCVFSFSRSTLGSHYKHCHQYQSDRPSYQNNYSKFIMKHEIAVNAGIVEGFNE